MELQKSITMRINIFGDYCIPELKGLHFGECLKSMLNSSEYNVVNLEAPIRTRDSKPISKSGPNLQIDKNTPYFLKDNNINVVSFANNHALDYGEESLIETKKQLSGISVVGAGTFEEAYRPCIVECNGLRVSIIAVTHYEFGVLDNCHYSSNKIGVAWMCHPCVDELIIEQKEQCDYVIVVPHAGLEYFEYPLPELKELYRHYINIGADCVIGGHPHTPQCTEIYNGKTIVYSLGNLCFDSPCPTGKMWNYSIAASISCDKDDFQVELTPLYYDTSTREVEICKETFYVEYLKSLNESFKDIDLYIKKVNEKCMFMEEHYKRLFEMSGYFRPEINNYARLLWDLIKRKIRKIERHKYPATHMINNLRCETHRWVISRIYELKYGNYKNGHY